ncbi:MAG: hypothetical protein Q7S65_01540 [Nanoarchaeota archaeon]|nr:hypothetical protein [Nanoarchaeota archaeon]
MPKVALILGPFYPEKLLEGFEQKIVKTVYGNVLLYTKAKNVILLRQGKGKIPAHRVNHKANMCALNVEGVEKIFAFDNVAPLNVKIKPGSFVLPVDYINFSDETFFDMEMKSIVPGISEQLRKEFAAATKKAKLTSAKGVYVQTKGPRVPTPAELKVIKSWGSIAGMTMGTEATLAREIGLPYACLCSIAPTKENPASQKKTLLRIEKIAQSILIANRK